MKQPSFWALVAAAGIALLAAAARQHPAAQWKIYFDGEQAQVRAREMSAAFGMDTQGWRATVTGGADSHAGFVSVPHFSPIFAKVALESPAGQGRVLSVVSASGDVTSWEWRGFGKTPAANQDPPQILALHALQKMAGEDAAKFHALPESAPDADSRVFSYEWPGGVAQHFEATTNTGRLVKAQLTAVYGRPVEQAVSARKKYGNWLKGGVGVGIDFLGGVLAACVYVFWAVRRAVRHRFVFAFSATALLWGALYWSNWMAYDERYDAVAGGGSVMEDFLGASALLLCIMLLLVILAGASDAIGPRPKLLTLRSVFSAAAFNREAGASALIGLAAGPLLAALPMALSALHLFGSQRTGDYDAELIFSAHPGLQALTVLVSPALLALFGFWTGFLARYIRARWLSLALLILPGVLLLSTLALPSESAPPAFLLNGAVLFAAYYVLFQRVDLLAVLSAAWCARVVWNAVAQLVQPSASLHVSGIAACACLGLSAVCAGLVAWRGRDLPPEEGVAPNVVTSERETLMREFSIAHRVQQQMLPAHPPEIPSCSVSASCHPAQEVGGDLFDFLQLPDGRWSIAVGDVSGKGVHAALYMTLTKGLLAATTQDSSDLVEILGNVNGHVHAATERKTFVTMALGAFNPESRGFDHVRAGHNPIVWRSPERGETSLLHAPGLGLGIVSDRLFRRSLRLEQVQLQAGDALVFYSDGVTEAMNAESEQFGEERLMRSVEEADGLNAGEVRERILADVRRFLDGVTPQDDMTLVVLRVN